MRNTMSGFGHFRNIFINWLLYCVCGEYTVENKATNLVIQQSVCQFLVNLVSLILQFGQLYSICIVTRGGIYGEI